LMIIDPVESVCRVRNEANRRRNVQCEFPFKFHGETYNGCIDFTDIKDGRKIPSERPWCSTKVRGRNRNHVGGGRNYGFCNSQCPMDGDRRQNNRPSPSAGQASGKNSGLWKPDGNKGECGKRNTISNIVGGAIAKIGEYPFMALLGYDPPNIPGNDIYYVCGGSLINKKYVLTAGHCIDTENGRPVEVVLGEHVVGKDPDCPRQKSAGSCNAPVIRRRINGNTDIILHESYDKRNNFKNDIALIRMNEPVPLFQESPALSSANPICLPWSKDSYAHFVDVGDKPTVAGWGRTVRRQDDRTQNNYLQRNRVAKKQLKQLKVPISNCPRLKIDRERQICAGGQRGKDSCNGDSGGPLFIRESSNDAWEQIGLVSFGSTRCGVGVPGVYTRIVHYLPWIESHLRP